MPIRKAGFTRLYYSPLLLSGSLSLAPVIAFELLAWNRQDTMFAWQAVRYLPLMAIAWLAFLTISAYGIAIKLLSGLDRNRVTSSSSEAVSPDKPTREAEKGFAE